MRPRACLHSWDTVSRQTGLRGTNNDPTGEIANILLEAGLGGFVKDVLTGAVVGGLGSVGVYGAGKAVKRLRGVLLGAL